MEIICLVFCLLFYSCSRIFRSYVTSEGLQTLNLNLCSALSAFEQRGVFIGFLLRRVFRWDRKNLGTMTQQMWHDKHPYPFWSYAVGAEHGPKSPKHVVRRKGGNSNSSPEAIYMLLTSLPNHIQQLLISTKYPSCYKGTRYSHLAYTWLGGHFFVACH